MALGWNAGVWAITLVTAVKVNMAAAASPILLALIATVALSPHVLLEGLAYLCGSLAAIFFSRGVTLYKPTDSRFFKVLNAVVVLAVYLLVWLFWQQWLNTSGRPSCWVSFRN